MVTQLRELEVDVNVVTAISELGIGIGKEFPKPMTDEVVDGVRRIRDDIAARVRRLLDDITSESG